MANILDSDFECVDVIIYWLNKGLKKLYLYYKIHKTGYIGIFACVPIRQYQ